MIFGQKIGGKNNIFGRFRRPMYRDSNYDFPQRYPLLKSLYPCNYVCVSDTPFMSISAHLEMAKTTKMTDLSRFIQKSLKYLSDHLSDALKWKFGLSAF